MAKRIAALMQGTAVDADVQFDLGEDKSQHLTPGPMPTLTPST